MIFINSEINDIHLEGLFFRIFEIPAVKMCFASKILPHVNTVFTETTVFKFHREQQFLAMLSQ